MRFVALLVLVTSCVEGTDPEPTITSGSLVKWIPMSINRRIDVLFVIDNSPAMAEHQAKLKANMRRFIDVLRSGYGGIPDLRLGVTTTDLGGIDCIPGDDGRLRGATGLTGNFVVDFVGPDASRLRNYDGDLADVFARMTDVGTSGCAHAQPLAAARRAIENPVNRGFFRNTAYLAVYFISAKDADANTSIEDTARFFKTIHDDPAKVIVGGVLGTNDPTAIIPRFLEQFPNRNSRIAMAEADWSQAFQMVTQLLRTTLGAPCVEGPLLDVDAETPGDQYECSVWYNFPVGGQVVPACDASLIGPCWKIEASPQQCPQSLGIFDIEHPRFDLPDETMLTIECLSR